MAKRCFACCMAGDTLLRWAAVLAAGGDCPLARLCILLQVALLYGTSILHKDW